MLPNVLQPNETDHVPVLAERGAAPARREPGRDGRRRHVRRGRPRRDPRGGARGNGKLIAVDRDPGARAYFERVAGDMRRPGALPAGRLLGRAASSSPTTGCEADAILLDLGVSSMQIDRPERGFSYAADAPLDMRMDPSADVTAAGIVNESAERELATDLPPLRRRALRAADRAARSCAGASEQPFERTRELVETIEARFPRPRASARGIPPSACSRRCGSRSTTSSARSRRALPSAIAMLRPGGRLAVISFHSLEDRIVKRFMRDRERGCTARPTSRSASAARARAALDLAKRDPADRRGDRPQPALRVGAASGGGQGLSMASLGRARTSRRDAGRRSHGRGRAPSTAPSAGMRAASSGSGWSPCCSPASSPTNVAVLRLNMQLDNLGQQRAELAGAERAALVEAVEPASRRPGSSRRRAKQLGLLPAAPDQTTYVDAPPRR